MKIAEGKRMGRIDVTVTIANNFRVMHAKEGTIPSSEIAKVEVRGIVDTGAAKLVLPQRVADELNLMPAGTVRVRYADNRSAKRPMVENVWLELAGRAGVFSAILEPKRETALIGAIVLEELDLICDCVTQSVRPRDPHGIISEIEELGPRP
jgi:predicted aspartyl protease